MRKLEIEEYKRISVDVLHSLHEFCEKNKLTYFLDCGTLIGCIRHEGFIPWDDDIDVLMPRDDFEKLVETYHEQGFTLFHYSKQRDFYYQYAKISKDGTVLDEVELPDIEGMGVNIDIFIMDGMPDNLMLRRIHQDVLAFLSKYRALMTRMGKALPKLAFLFRWRWVDFLLNYLGRKYSSYDTKYCGNITATTIRHKEIPKECFDSVIQKPFEGSLFNVPVGYDEYLSKMYGDYMKLPPKEKRIPKHHFDAYIL